MEEKNKNGKNKREQLQQIATGTGFRAASEGDQEHTPGWNLSTRRMVTGLRALVFRGRRRRAKGVGGEEEGGVWWKGRAGGGGDERDIERETNKKEGGKVPGWGWGQWWRCWAGRW